MKKSLGEEIAQRDKKIAELEQVNSDRLEEITTLNAQLKERGEIDGILHSGGEPVLTDPFIREKRLREQLGKINVDHRLSKQSEAAAKAQTSKAENRIMELEAKVSNLPEDSSTDLGLLRANATREMTDLKKARDEFGATRLTLFELEKASLTETELDEMSRRYLEKEKECVRLEDKIDELKELLESYDTNWKEESESEDPLPAASLHAMDRVQRKRTADEALFTVDPAAAGTKRLKLSTEINIGQYVSSSTRDFYSIGHNKVL